MVRKATFRVVVQATCDALYQKRGARVSPQQFCIRSATSKALCSVREQTVFVFSIDGSYWQKVFSKLRLERLNEVWSPRDCLDSLKDLFSSPYIELKQFICLRGGSTKDFAVFKIKKKNVAKISVFLTFVGDSSKTSSKNSCQKLCDGSSVSPIPNFVINDSRKWKMPSATVDVEILCAWKVLKLRQKLTQKASSTGFGARHWPLNLKFHNVIL